MTKLGRAGIGVAIAGALALAVHGMLLARPARGPSDRALYRALLARQVQLRSDCAAWDAAVEAIPESTPAMSEWIFTEFERQIVTNALDDPDMQVLLRARVSLIWRRELLALLLPALRDPSFVGLRDTGDVTVEGRNMPLQGRGTIVREDLFTRAGRASWLLKQVTGHRAPVVGARMDPRRLVDISDDWRVWFLGMDVGYACRRPGVRRGG